VNLLILLIAPHRFCQHLPLIVLCAWISPCGPWKL